MVLSFAVTSWAGDHDAVPAPAAIEVVAAPIPDGPPVQATAEAGDDLAAAVRALPAGSTLRLGPGSYRGPVVLDRPMSLIGSRGTVIDGGGVGSILFIAAPDVVVSDLRVTGGGHSPQANDSGVVAGGDRFRIERVVVDSVYLGIDVRRADGGLISGCTITGPGEGSFVLRGDALRLWEADRTEVIDNVIEGARDLVVWYSNDNHIARNSVTNSRYGTHFMHTSGNVVEGNTYRDDVVGVFSMYSDDVHILDNVVVGANGQAGMGIGLKESEAVVVVGNRLLDNTTGIYLDNSPQRVGGKAEIAGNLVAGNDTGLRFHGGGKGAVFTDNSISANGVSASVDGNSDALGSSFSGNFWSDYAGYDLDGDQQGDLPFELTSLSGELQHRRPTLSFFQGTPAAALLDLFAAAFPMFAPKPILRDDHPAMRARR